MDYEPRASVIEYIGLGCILAMLGLGLVANAVPDDWLKPVVHRVLDPFI